MIVELKYLVLVQRFYLALLRKKQGSGLSSYSVALNDPHDRELKLTFTEQILVRCDENNFLPRKCRVAWRLSTSYISVLFGGWRLGPKSLEPPAVLRDGKFSRIPVWAVDLPTICSSVRGKC